MIETANKITGDNEDDIILNSLIWMINNIIYAPDRIPAKEWWQRPEETIRLRTGDCEDQNILLMSLLLAKGIDPDRLMLRFGAVFDGTKKVNHIYITYRRRTDDKYIILDATWYPTIIPVKDRLIWEKEITYKELSFSWNQKYGYKTDQRV